MDNEQAFEIVLFLGGISGAGWTAAVWDYDNGPPPSGARDRYNPESYVAVSYGDTPESALSNLPKVYRTRIA